MLTTNGQSPRQAILYGRVSTDEQASSGSSLAQQLEALKEYALREGYEAFAEVVDPGWSRAHLHRPGFDHVRDLVRNGSVDVMLAQDKDRFAREPAYDYLLSTYIFPTLGRRSCESNSRSQACSVRRDHYGIAPLVCR